MVSLSVVTHAFEISSVPMLLVAPDGTVKLANGEFLSLFGYEQGELLGGTIDCLLPDGLRERHSQYVSAYLRVPAKRAMGLGRSLVGLAKSGEAIPLELGLNTVDIEGEVHCIVVAVDLRMQVGHEQKMELAMEAAATAMIMTDPDGLIVLVNAATEKLSGYTRDELLGNPVELLVPKAQRIAHRVFRSNYATMPERRDMSAGRPISVLTKTHEVIPVEVSLTPVATPEGKMVMSTIVDLRERIAAEEAVRRKNEELDTLNRNLTEINGELSQFTYAVSHDLKAPLASIQGLLRIMLEDLDLGQVDDVRENIVRVTGLCERYSTKVERVYNLSRSPREVTPSQVDLDEMLTEIWRDITADVTMPAHLTRKLDVRQVTASQPSLEVVLQNLLANALRFHDPAKPAVEVVVGSQVIGRDVQISVSDNGVGIPKEYHKRVFDIFKRVDNRGGDGIGLAVVQKHIDSLGGSVSVDSAVGEGTTIHVQLSNPKESAECVSRSS